MQLFVRSLTDGSLVVDSEPHWKVETLKRCVEETCGVPCPLQRLVFARRELDDACELGQCGLEHGDMVTLVLRLRGGKGGFGALLRGQGRDGKITTNYDACRDLSGRRLRHINAEKKLDEWAKEAKERELEQVALRHVKEKARDESRQKKAEVDIGEVLQERQSALTSVRNAVHQGLRATPGFGDKRKMDDAQDGRGRKKSRLGFMALDEDEEMSSEDETLDVAMGETRQEGPGVGSRAEGATGLGRTGTTDQSSKVDEAQGREPSPEYPEVDLSRFENAKSLEGLGLDVLKEELKRRGLLCGGTLSDRASRLFLLKNVSIDAIDKKHLAKKA